MTKRPPADDLYLAAHDGIGGRALLAPAVLAIGLGAALLGELLFWRRVRMSGDTLQVIDEQPTADLATSRLLERLVAMPGPHGLHQWIVYLPATGLVTDLIEQRLTTGGALRRETRRRLLGSTSSLVFTDPRGPGEPAARIRTALSYNQPLDVADLMLAGMILATGLDEFVLATCNPRDRARLSDQFRRNLPEPLHHLIAQTRDVAVHSAVGR
ncbi:GPP34 family phosphoprotein [Actinoplanes derwentensis]|uniref:Golgi phosphoprotein 3 (GPP34) n=1 Tax=Actinoplanes derwentensis TaxID=113562 RepID=A0A1H1Z4U5_9ACTN|nr:GPP34 family phosphoprotein [Actinoplanes derwentensis]GID81426.1 hypothetical protein Ade03nite_03500 [Actinoplanes derwentensis]SDT28582.1 Golgi phosphoprotein 3 (GPP34) [Actinoplanes derwentensis]